MYATTVNNQLPVVWNTEIINDSKTTDTHVENTVKENNEKASLTNDIINNKTHEAENGTVNVDQHSKNTTKTTSSSIKIKQNCDVNKQLKINEQNNKNRLQKQESNVKISNGNVSKKTQFTLKENKDTSANYSTMSICSVKPKIFSGPGEVQNETNPWSIKSKFDDLAVNIVHVRKGSEHQYSKLLEQITRMRSIPVTSYMEGHSYMSYQQDSGRQATHNAFTKSRIATLRKSPARLVLPVSIIFTESLSTISSTDSLSDPISGTVRIDEANVFYPRFDPYHSECGLSCRRCLFLTQTLPHLYSKVTKIKKVQDMSKSVRNRIGFAHPPSKSIDL